jgi:hypothetical protein
MVTPSQPPADCFGWLCTDSAFWHGEMDTIITKFTVLVHSTAVLVVTCWTVLVPHYIRKSSVGIYCRSQ